jgi:hypothetical protein
MARPSLPEAARLVAIGGRVRASTAAVLAEEAARRRTTLSAIVREIAETAAESIRERQQLETTATTE